MTDSLGNSRDGLFAGTAWHYARYRPGYPRLLFDDLVDRFGLDGTGRLLDLGCGTAQLLLPLAEHVAEAVGIDPEPEMLARSAFRTVHRRVYEFERSWTIRQIIGYLYSTSLPLRRLLGDRRSDFEQAITTDLLDIDSSGRFVEPVALEALFATRR